jgi:mannose-6-phosphate isomerase-like protein (cupin superfamily)
MGISSDSHGRIGYTDHDFKVVDGQSQEVDMPVVKNGEAKEIPWRAGYRNYVLAGEAQGVSVSSSLGVLEQGAGAPLHFHEEVDEVIVVLEGTLDLRIGDERLLVGKDQTISIPARTPHAFTVVSPEGARFIAFLPRQGAHMATKYIEGDPPLGAALK